MSGQGLPYRLRPNKYIDRELFAELIALVVADSAPSNFVYISMGGDHLTDHFAIYRRAGIKNLYAFDRNNDVVARQIFNAPFERVRCSAHESGEIPALLDGILDSYGAERSIIWLDFTEPKRRKQLAEVEALAKQLEPGDIIRVSFNADFSKLDKREANLKEAEKLLPPAEKTAALLHLELGAYLPNRVTEVYFDKINSALSLAVERALQNGLEKAGSGYRAIPALLTEYQDTTKMFTATALIAEAEGLHDIPKSWSYLPEAWTDILKIYAPDLSARERHAIDLLIHQDVAEIANGLPFPVEHDALTSYSRFHRFYPTFQPVVD